MDTTAPRTAGFLSHLPSRLHHHAFVVRDHETNRRFFEDLLGIPLVATWCEKTFSTDLNKEIEFCHTFFGMADGSSLVCIARIMPMWKSSSPLSLVLNGLHR